MQQLHLDACNPSAVRAEVTCCSYPTGVLARRYGSAPRPAASGASLDRTIASTTRPSMWAAWKATAVPTWVVRERLSDKDVIWF